MILFKSVLKKGRMATIPSSVSNQVLVDLLKAELLNASSLVLDPFTEIIKRWSAASTLTTLAVTTGMPMAPSVGVRLSTMGVKLEKPEKFTGAPAVLENWLFNIKLFCEMHRILYGTEMVKLAVGLIGEQALTWWRAESIKPWATTGVLNW